MPEAQNQNKGAGDIGSVGIALDLHAGKAQTATVKGGVVADIEALGTVTGGPKAVFSIGQLSFQVRHGEMSEGISKRWRHRSHLFRIHD